MQEPHSRKSQGSSPLHLTPPNDWGVERLTELAHFSWFFTWMWIPSHANKSSSVLLFGLTGERERLTYWRTAAPVFMAGWERGATLGRGGWGNRRGRVSDETKNIINFIYCWVHLYIERRDQLIDEAIKLKFIDQSYDTRESSSDHFVLSEIENKILLHE